MPDVRCAFGLVRQGTRPSSLTPSVPRRSRVLAARSGFVPSSRAPVFSHARSPALRAAPNHRHRQRSSASGPVRATRRPSRVLLRFRFSRESVRVVISLSGRAPSVAAHGATRITSGTCVTGHSHSCNAQLHRLPLHRSTVGPQAIRHPRAIGLRLARPSGGSGNHTSFNGRT